MSKLNDLTRGVVVFALLAVLTAIEYLLAINHIPGAVLWLVALLKGGLVVWYFMHLARVLRPSDGGHE
jgi:cytochrome c oxidase subunit IV